MLSEWWNYVDKKDMAKIQDIIRYMSSNNKLTEKIKLSLDK